MHFSHYSAGSGNSNNDVSLYLDVICMNGTFAIHVFMHFSSCENQCTASQCFLEVEKLRGWAWRRQRERSQSEKAFSHPVQWISNTVFCPRGQFMHWNPELLHSMRHLVSSMCITPSYEWEMTLALGQLRPSETGWWVWNLRNYVLDWAFYFQFVYIFLLCGWKYHLKGKLWSYSINLWCLLQE